MDRTLAYLEVVTEREFLDFAQIFIADQVHHQLLRGIANEFLLVVGQFARYLREFLVGQFLDRGDRLPAFVIVF